ncbi:ABC-2 type transporter family protein [Medicago truncatula]|uniref:ABC-2 type transporter family protein n=1 Tax=Medicago truncatula TaxID=3880 RepID=G7KTH4_MEDTR|nr:ABC-2 type transporter family protein [Medicago truncatula]
MVMIWEDVTVTIGEDKKKKLLDGVTGFAEPGRIMAVMGPSGCGKTTLLTSLAETLAANVAVTGNIQINGKKRSLYSKEVTISNGEKKRLSIGLEILTQPLVLLLDEPTVGLDSLSILCDSSPKQHIALKGKLVICSIHQPGCETFNIFDGLLLLSNGETV